MSDLVRGNVATDIIGSENQAPVHPDSAARRAAAPARRGVTNRNRARNNSSSSRKFSDILRNAVAGVAFEELFDSRRKCVFGASTAQLAIDDQRSASERFLPNDR